MGSGDSDLTGLADSDTPVETARPGRHVRRWLVVAFVLLAVGVAASIVGSLSARASVHNQAKRTFQSTAADVTNTLASSLRVDLDFVTSIRGVATMRPGLSNAEFAEWYRQLQGPQRLTGGAGTALIASVPASGVPAFAAQFERDPTFRAVTGGAYRIFPSGLRSRYCLVQAIAGAPIPKSQAAVLEADLCADTAYGPTLRAMADSGTYSATIVPGVSGPSLFTGAPVYRLGAPVASVAQRRAALVGWVAGSFDPSALIRAAIAGHGQLNVALYHRNQGGPVELVGQDGASTQGLTLARSTPVPAAGVWTIRVRGVPQVAGISATAVGLLVLVGGLIVTLLLFALTMVLTRSREGALRLVTQKTDELRFRALHDSLTKLPNRALVLDRTEQMLARARRHGVPVAIMYIDLDGFKQVNDTFGHAAGDELLRVVAERLMAVMRESDTVGRLAGDEFVVLLESASLDAGPELVAQRIIDVLAQPIELSTAGGKGVSVTASVGIALGQRPDAEQLLRDADLAMYAAKTAGRSRYVIFEAQMQVAAQDRLDLELELAGALDAGQLFLMYQPIFDLETETATGVEALLRWRHPTRGIVPPDAFIPLAENSGLIVEIGRWVLDRACAQAAAWRNDGHELGMAVNVSGRQLDEDVLIEDVRGAIERHHLDAEHAHARDHRDDAHARRRGEREAPPGAQGAGGADLHR